MNFQHAVARFRRTFITAHVRQLPAALCIIALPSLTLIDTSFVSTDFVAIAPANASHALATDPVTTRLPVKPQAQAITPPGNDGATDQTLADRTVATVLPFQGDESEPSDPRRDQQWSFFDTTHYKGAAALFAAQPHSLGINSVIVAVVDSGVMLEHEDLQVAPGYDFVSVARVANDGDGRDDDPSDPGDWVTAEEITTDPISDGCGATPSKWHGTAVSGIIGAISNNQRGISGGAPSVLLLPVRVTGKCGGYINDLVDGVRWAAGLPVNGAPRNHNPARIINLSVGFPGECPAALQSAINDATSAGAILVAAATNSGAVLDEHPQAPANCNQVITVGAVLRNGNLAYYSARGHDVSLLAPGGSAADGIITTQNNSTTTPSAESGYGFHFGTSMAAAHVSAALATLLTIEPTLSNDHLQQLVLQSALNKDNIEGCAARQCGAGRLNASGAVALLSQSDGLPPSVAVADDEPTVAAASTTSGTTGNVADAGGGAGSPGITWVVLLLISAVHRRRHS